MVAGPCGHPQALQVLVGPPRLPTPAHGSGYHVSSWGRQSLPQWCHSRAGLQLPTALPCPGPAERGPPVAQCLAPRLPPSCPPSWLGWWDGPWPPGPALTAPRGSPHSYWTLFPRRAPGPHGSLANGAHCTKQPTPPTARQIHFWRRRRKRILLQLLMPQNLHQRTTSVIAIFRGMPCRHKAVTALHTGCHR